MLYLFVPGNSFAQSSEDIITTLDCSIPFEAQQVRPGEKGTKIPVKVGFFLIDIKNIDDVGQTYIADIMFNVTWNDPRLSQKALGKSLEDCTFSDEIWSPTLMAVNRSVSEHLDKVVAKVDPEGNVNIRQRYIGEFSSDLDFTDFPFDDQILHFIMIAAGPDGRDIIFEVDDSKTGQRDNFSVEGWTVTLIDGVSSLETVETRAQSDNTISFGRIDFSLDAKRDKRYYVWKVIAPLCLIVLMAWAVFWIDPKHLGPQVGLSTATVFTLIAYRFAIGFNLPKVSYFTRMDNFVLFSTILVFLALGTAIATSKISSDGGNKLAKLIEKYMRVIYLVVFVSIIVFTLWL